ncbi:MAG TPA: TonB-dependent receptor, partial [Terriglobia bacterium]|nr:TonB-dependent receptor [Terriglobia bacterium]
MALLAIGFFFRPASLHAQAEANSGQIVGQVLDPSGAAVPMIEVIARNKNTNLTRSMTTDVEGRFATGPVPLGTYEVTALPIDMEPSSQQVYVSLGGRGSANFTLGLAAVRESIHVVADAPAVIEPSQTFSKAVLTELQLRNLPAPGRRIRQLFLLTPTTQIEPECGGFSIGGQKGVYTALNVDGSDYTSTHFCGHIEMSPTFTIEALQEFQVLRSTFSAEFGRSTGGIINLATKSGTNQLHGSGFYLFRNDGLTHRDVFGREQMDLGNQFGGSLGGPIRLDRTFFFLAGEMQRNTKPVHVLYSQLDIQGVRNSLGAQALLAVAPEGRLTAVSQFQSTVNRIDHALNENRHLTGRLDVTRSKITSSAGSFINTNGLGADSETNRDVENSSPTSNRTNVTGMVQFSAVLSPRHINEIRVALQREYRPWNPGDSPEVTVRHGSPLQTVAIYGAQGTGLSYGNVGYKFTDQRYQFVDNFSIVTGSHTMKLGADANLVFSATVFNPGFNGTYRFDGLDNYLARIPAQYDQFAGSGTVNSRKHQIAFYWQDEWRALPGLTLSPGFRYEMALMPDYPAPTVPANRAPQATELPSDYEMFGPRLGLAWDVNQEARTVLRGAAGVFYAPPYLAVFEQAMVSNGGNPELSSRVTLHGS